MSRMRCRAKRCTADPGPPPTGTIPGLQRTTPCCAAPGTRLYSAEHFGLNAGKDRPTATNSSQEETMPARRAKHPVVTLVAAAAALSVASVAFAQDKTFELKLSHWVPPTHPLQKAMEEWGASVEKASNGTIKSKVFPSQQLGKAFDHYDMARDGIADFTYVNPGYQPGRFPIIAAGELPFLVGDAKGGIRAVDAWYRKYAPTEMKDVKYCFSFIL